MRMGGVESIYHVSAGGCYKGGWSVEYLKPFVKTANVSEHEL